MRLGCSASPGTHILWTNVTRISCLSLNMHDGLHSFIRFSVLCEIPMDFTIQKHPSHPISYTSLFAKSIISNSITPEIDVSHAPPIFSSAHSFLNSSKSTTLPSRRALSAANTSKCELRTSSGVTPRTDWSSAATDAIKARASPVSPPP
jgi:hypothetical protein